MMDNNLRKAARLLPWLILPCFAAQADYKENYVLGIDGGYAWRDATAQAEAMATASNTVYYKYIRDHDDDGGIFGVFGGLQFQCNRWLMGMELNVGWQDFGDNKEINEVWLGNSVVGHAEYDRGWVLNLSFRLGYQVWDQLLGYVRLGIETSNDRIKSDMLINGAPGFTMNESHRSNRYVVGAGVEYPIIEQISVRVEYNYSKRDGSFAWAYSNILGTSSRIFAEIEPNQHAVKAALVWNFV